MFRLSPLELWTPLILVSYIVTFVRSAQRSKQRQAVARKAQETTAEAGRRGVLAQLWLAATKPNLFYAQGDRRAPLPLIVGLLLLTSVVEATPRLIILARAGPAWKWPSAEAVGSAFISSSLGGIMTNVAVFLLMARPVGCRSERPGMDGRRLRAEPTCLCRGCKRRLGPARYDFPLPDFRLAVTLRRRFRGVFTCSVVRNGVCGGNGWAFLAFPGFLSILSDFLCRSRCYSARTGRAEHLTLFGLKRRASRRSAVFV